MVSVDGKSTKMKRSAITTVKYLGFVFITLIQHISVFYMLISRLIQFIDRPKTTKNLRILLIIHCECLSDLE